VRHDTAPQILGLAAILYLRGRGHRRGPGAAVVGRPAAACPSPYPSCRFSSR
jgi:hypothetical protein